MSSLFLNAQNIKKTEEIYFGGGSILNAINYYDGEKLVRRIFYLAGQDSDYKHIVKVLIVRYDSTANEKYSFLKGLSDEK
jgi:hypothetical protein